MNLGIAGIIKGGLGELNEGFYYIVKIKLEE